MDEGQVREQLCQAVRQLWTRGMLVGCDGLLSCEVHRRRYLVTPIGHRRIDLDPNDLVCVDIGGENVHGGEGIPLNQWQPHRDVYQSHTDPGDTMLGASALIEPANILALLTRNDGADRLDLGCDESLKVVDADNPEAVREALSSSAEVVLRGSGARGSLLVAAADLSSLLNRIERIDLFAAVKLAGGR